MHYPRLERTTFCLQSGRAINWAITSQEFQILGADSLMYNLSIDVEISFVCSYLQYKLSKQYVDEDQWNF